MKRITRIVVLMLLVLVTAYVCLHCWQRIRFWRFVQKSPDTVARIKLEPSNLDLSAVALTNTTTYRIGYAEFALPSSCAVSLYSYDGTYVIGKSEAFEFSFMAPVNILATNKLVHGLNSSLARLPTNHPLVREMSDSKMTDLDLWMRAERLTTLPTLWQLMRLDRASFTDTFMRYLIKGYFPYGCDVIYFYIAEETRGLVRVGQSDCHASAHVEIEDRMRKRSTIFMIKMREQNESNVMPLLLPFLKSFHFLGETIPPKESLTKLIRSAGIEPQPDNVDNENSQ